MEQASRFYPSRILCQFLQIFLEKNKLPLFENFLFSPPCPEVPLCVKVCVCVLPRVCACVCERVCMCLLFVYLNY